VNNISCLFAKLDSFVKCRLFTAYCSSFYGLKLWNLDINEIDSFSVAWRKGIVYLLADSIPIYDELCRRFTNFVHSALNSECRLVECVVRYGLCICPMKSPIGRNAVTRSLRYSESHDRFIMFQFSKGYF